MIKVLTSGLYTSIQDLGRHNYKTFGVPISGVMDRYSAVLANQILGNNLSCAVLELTMQGPKLQFQCNAQLCISGANMQPNLNTKPVKNNTIINVVQNDVLSFGKLQNGFRAYLAVKGGFKSEISLASQSMYANITKAKTIKKNDILFVNKTNSKTIHTHAKLTVEDSFFNSETLLAYKGPEFEYLTLNQQEQLFNKSFTISANNNRMGYQLKELFKNNLDAIITSFVMPGTVQLTASGKLIVLMQDCQTTGGYPRILQLTQQAINKLAQKYTGKTIRLKLV